MIERVAVHQQDRRSLATSHGDDTSATGLDLGSPEAFEQHVRTWPCFAVVSRPCAGHPRLFCQHNKFPSTARASECQSSRKESPGFAAEAGAGFLSIGCCLACCYALVREELAETIHRNESLGAPSPRAMEKLFAAIDAEPSPAGGPGDGRGRPCPIQPRQVAPAASACACEGRERAHRCDRLGR